MGLFEIKINDAHQLKGNEYLCQDNVANMLIITGMQEYSKRYEYFAKQLNNAGISVYVLDHFGQGENAKTVDDLQKWPRDAWYMMVKALNIKIEELKKENKPVYLMGHSMGSFAVQTYLEEYPNTVDKVIIMGSNGPAVALYAIANFIAKLTVTKKKWDKPSKLLTSLSLGGYSKAIKNRKTDLDWLSYNEDNVNKYINDPYCGHTNTCGFFKEFLAGMNKIYRKKKLSNISKDEKILIVSGKEDPVGNNQKGVIKLRDMYQKLGLLNVNMILYDNARHEILNEDIKDQVISDILTFIHK